MAVTFHFYLKKRSNKKDEYPIYLRITANRKHKYLTTGLSVYEKQWNPIQERIRKSHPSSVVLNRKLEILLDKARTTHIENSQGSKNSIERIVSELKIQDRPDFFKIAYDLKQQFITEGKLTQSKNITNVLNKLEDYEGKSNLELSKVDVAYLEGFESFLKTKFQNKPNTINHNFKVIKIVLKSAYKMGLIDSNPVYNFDGAKKSRYAKKVSLTIEQINQIKSLEFTKYSFDWYVQQAFLFSFYSGGIRFGDLCCLTWDNIVDEKLVYTMNKNEKSFSMKLTDNQWNILLSMDDTSKYIFPFLNDSKDYSDPITLRRAIGSRNAQVNGKKSIGNETGLKKIALLAGIDENISFHVSRHSFAQYAIDNDIPLPKLMVALKHSDLATTQNYIKTLDEDAVNSTMEDLFG